MRDVLKPRFFVDRLKPKDLYSLMNVVCNGRSRIYFLPPLHLDFCFPPYIILHLPLSIISVPGALLIPGPSLIRSRLNYQAGNIIKRSDSPCSRLMA